MDADKGTGNKEWGTVGVSACSNAPPPPCSPSPSRPLVPSIFRWFLAWLFVSLAFMAWQHHVLFSPPYWDSAMGLAAEAEFLVQTDFDYHRLFFEEPRFLRGGSAVYLTSVLPTTMAVLRELTPSPAWAHFWYRLFTMGCASALVLGVFAWVAPPRVVAGTLRAPSAETFRAVLLAGALATTPVFLTQAELLGMEMPLAAVALLGGSLLARGRYLAAALVALASFFVKANGMLVIMASVTYLVLLGLLFWQRPWGQAPTPAGQSWVNVQKRRYVAGMVAILLAFALERGVTRWLQTLPTYEEITGFFDLSRGARDLLLCAERCPDVAAVFLIAVLASAAYVVARVRCSPGFVAALRAIASDDPILLFSWILVAGILVAHAWTHVIPRYLVFPLVFVYIGLGRIVLRWPRVTPWVNTALVAVIAANLWNSDGRWYLPLAGSDARTGAWRERSREYLADHQSNIRAVRTMVRHAEHQPVVAPNPFVAFLSIPGLGYVERPIRGYSVNATTNAFFRHVDELRRDDAPTVILLSIANRFSDIGYAVVPAAEESDEVLYTDESEFSDSPLVVFVPRGVAGSGQSDRQAALRRLWPWLDSMAEADRLAAAGQADQAIDRLKAEWRRYPKGQTAEVQVKLGEVCEKAGRTNEAIHWYTNVPVAPLYRARAMDRLSRLLSTSGQASDAAFYRHQADEARWFFREKATLDPQAAP